MMTAHDTHPSQLRIWRDSVCAGDDCDAPHEIEIAIAEEGSTKVSGTK